MMIIIYINDNWPLMPVVVVVVLFLRQINDVAYISVLYLQHFRLISFDDKIRQFLSCDDVLMIKTTMMYVVMIYEL